MRVFILLKSICFRKIKNKLSISQFLLISSYIFVRKLQRTYYDNLELIFLEIKNY